MNLFICSNILVTIYLSQQVSLDQELLLYLWGVEPGSCLISGNVTFHIRHQLLWPWLYFIGMISVNTWLFLSSKLIANKAPTEAPKAPNVPLKSCLLLNISQCDVSEHSSQFVVTVYNPLSHPISHHVRVPVSGASYTVQDPTGKELTVQMVPIPQPVIEVPGRVSPATMVLVFLASDLPPLGFRSYFISQNNHTSHLKQHVHRGEDVTLGNSVSATSTQYSWPLNNLCLHACTQHTKKIPLEINFI